MPQQAMQNLSGNKGEDYLLKAKCKTKDKINQLNITLTNFPFAVYFSHTVVGISVFDVRILEEIKMKTWSKPVMNSVNAGFEISRYLPAELGSCKKK